MPAARPDRRRLLRRPGALAGLSLAAIVLGFAGAALDGYGRHPGFALRIGDLEYPVGADRLVARAVTLDSPSATLKVGRLCQPGHGVS